MNLGPGPIRCGHIDPGGKRIAAGFEIEAIDTDLEIEDDTPAQKELVHRAVGRRVDAIEGSTDKKVARPASKKLIASGTANLGPAAGKRVVAAAAIQSGIDRDRQCRRKIIIAARADDLFEVQDAVSGLHPDLRKGVPAPPAAVKRAVSPET